MPAVPEIFFARIHGVDKDERFEHKDGRGVVYPQKSSEAFEYRWIDGQLVIVDTTLLLININPLLVWYPDINRLSFIKPSIRKWTPPPPTHPDALANAGSHPQSGVYRLDAARSLCQYPITSVSDLRADKGRRRKSGSIFNRRN